MYHRVDGPSVAGACFRASFSRRLILYHILCRISRARGCLEPHLCRLRCCRQAWSRTHEGRSRLLSRRLSVDLDIDLDSAVSRTHWSAAGGLECPPKCTVPTVSRCQCIHKACHCRRDISKTPYHMASSVFQLQFIFCMDSTIYRSPCSVQPSTSEQFCP